MADNVALAMLAANNRMAGAAEVQGGDPTFYAGCATAGHLAATQRNKCGEVCLAPESLRCGVGGAP